MKLTPFGKVQGLVDIVQRTDQGPFDALVHKGQSRRIDINMIFARWRQTNTTHVVSPKVLGS